MSKYIHLAIVLLFVYITDYALIKTCPGGEAMGATILLVFWQTVLLAILYMLTEPKCKQ